MCLACFLYFCSSVTGTPKSLKYHVYASDLVVTRNTLVAKYDMNMIPKCSSIMDPRGSLENPQKHICLNSVEMYPDVSTHILLGCFHAYPYKKKHMAYPDPQPEPCKDFLVVYLTQIFSICDAFKIVIPVIFYVCWGPDSYLFLSVMDLRF